MARSKSQAKKQSAGENTTANEPFYPPPIGATFAVAIGDGNEALCRVIGHDENKGACIVYAKWWAIMGGTNEATLREYPETRAPLVLTHHSWDAVVHGGWVKVAPPSTLRYVGIADPSEDERSLLNEPLPLLGGWEFHPFQVIAQWRWDNERDVVLAEDAAGKEAERKATQAAVAKQDAARKKASRDPVGSLKKLRKQKFFAEWRKYVVDDAITEARGLIYTAIDTLLVAKKAPSEALVTKTLKQCVRAFNKMDAKRDHFIATLEAEHIMDALFEIATVCGLSELAFNEHVDDVREF